MPPLTVASLATIITSRPDTRPMPVTMPRAGASSSYMSDAASGDTRGTASRIEQPRDPLAHGQLALRSRCRSIAFAPPPSRARAQPLTQRRRPAGPFWSRLAWKTGSAGSTWVQRKHRLSGQSSVARFSGHRHQPQQSVLNPQAGQRQTACMRHISATPQRSHIHLCPTAVASVTFERRRLGRFRGVGIAHARELCHARRYARVRKPRSRAASCNETVA